MGWNMAGLGQRLEGWRGTDGPVALVLRLDDGAQLARVLGQGRLADLLGQFAARIGVALRLATPPRVDAGGHVCLILAARDAGRALQQAARLQAICGKGFVLAGEMVTPGISAVVVRAGTAEPRPRDEALFDAGRRHLSARGLADRTRIALIDWVPAQAAPSSPIVADAPPQSAAWVPADPAAEVDVSMAEAHFQPQLCCHTGEVSGFELLARLRHPLQGLMRPAEFLPRLSAAQHRALTRTMLNQGLAALRAWDRAGHRVGTVSLNVHAADLMRPHFGEIVLWELDRHDVAPSRLLIEVMETLAPTDAPQQVADNLQRLRIAGCRIDLDDFGTGYASLDAIRRLGVNRVKIDRSFVVGCDRDPDQQRMILAVLALAEHLGLDTLAEGVETPGEHAFAAQIGCSHVQGYAIARPMPLAETHEFLSAHRAHAAELPVLRRRA